MDWQYFENSMKEAKTPTLLLADTRIFHRGAKQLIRPTSAIRKTNFSSGQKKYRSGSRVGDSGSFLETPGYDLMVYKYIS